MGNLPQEQEITQNVTDVEIKKIDENNDPNPPKFYINKDLSNKFKISEIISQVFRLNNQDITTFENHNLIEFTFKQNSLIHNKLIKNDSSNKKNLNYFQNENKKENLTLNPTNNNNINSPDKKKDNTKKKAPRRLGSILFKKPIETNPGSLLHDIRKVYKFKEVLGGGHFGTVRIAYKRKEEPKRYYAIKSISKKNLSPSDLKDLIKEVDIISGLDHPVIIDFYETYQDDFFFHIVMEYCKGKEVFQKIASEGKIEEKKVARVIFKVLNAIAYCHSKGITHRDIKPENILFETDEPYSDIKIIDFGLSRKYSVDQKMHTILGTPYYIAPEVLKGNYDEKCDIWSIGALTYIMLSGEPPFKGKSNNEIFMKIIKDPIKFNPYKWNNLTENSKDFIKICLNKDPDKRPSAIEALSHKWFLHFIQDSNQKYITQDILLNIKNFNYKQQFKIMVLRYLLSLLNEGELKKYKKAFYAINYKNNGTISKEEMKKAFLIGKIDINDDIINNVFRLVDQNEKGTLDYTDFLIASYDKKDLLTEKKLELAFQYYDVDNSGLIEIHDLKDAMLRHGKAVVDSNDTKKLIQEITKYDNLETIDFKQFCKMFH